MTDRSVHLVSYLLVPRPLTRGLSLALRQPLLANPGLSNCAGGNESILQSKPAVLCHAACDAAYRLVSAPACCCCHVTGASVTSDN